MRSYLPEQIDDLEDPATLQRLKPFLSDVFDPISLDRPGFLAEIGLQPTDECWLRAGAYFQSWLFTPVLPRALSEEARSKKLTNLEFLERSKGMNGEALWRQGERLFLRCQRLLNHSEASKAAEQLGLKLPDYEALRTRWKKEMDQKDQLMLNGILLQLRGVGQETAALAKRMDEQTTETYALFLTRNRPMLTEVSDEEIELTMALELNGKTFSVAASFAKEVAENQELPPELWAKGWGDFISTRTRFSSDEFRALLEHFQDRERYKWPNLVAIKGATKARRAVAAVALAALQKLESAEDTASIDRLWQMIPDFSERYDLQQVLKKRFNL
ncbi:hypothetical protein ABS71_09365 [bacterium SCN 62-11]|nr:hypothetical protein [Candidatus Eremiobacteraeota bacterium]ODT68897.1 MAG: hypothetical protein ABS71_09365 [bacterium SCN 62-11]